MNKREPAEQARVNLLKRLRSQIRLEHSLLADDELNELLPHAEKIFNAALSRGELLNAGEIWSQLGKKALGE